ncbi:MAG: DUF2029 domain-containing protein [Gemmatimonadota bacterium]|nr:MAG: DUF2029 domain-containing protein [Gemmatimonadota bacterium]
MRSLREQGQVTEPRGGVWDKIAGALGSPLAKRVLLALLVVLVAFLWWNMVRRAVQGHGSQFDDWIEFSRDLVYERVDVYREYSWQRTSIGKYPPFFSLLFAPLVPLPTRLAASLWFWLNLVLAAGATYLSVRTVDETDGVEGKRLSMFWIPLVLAAGIIGSNLETAQVNIVILFFLCLALYLFKRSADLSAGLALGLITALKLTPGLFIVYFAYKRAYRVVLGAVLGLLVCWLLVPPLVLGIDHFTAVMSGWYGRLNPFLVEGTLAEGVAGFRHTNQSLSAAFHRYFTATPAGGGRTDFYINLLSLGYVAADRVVKLLSLVIVVALAWICRTPLGDRHRLMLSFEYALVMIAALFISPISWINHYVVLLFPYTAAVYYVRTRPASRPGRRLILYSLVASFLLVSSSASRLLQAFSLPFLGASILAAAMVIVVVREGRSEAAVRVAEPAVVPPGEV